VSTRAADSALGRGRLRAQLKTARERAGLTQQEVVEDLGWSLSKLVRIESGHVAISRTDLKALLETLGRGRDEGFVAEMIGLASIGRHQWWSKYRDFLNPDFINYLGYLDAAARAYEFQQTLIPGALQCEAYVRALIESQSVGATTERVERRIEARLARQEMFTRDDRPEITYVISEAALRTWVGRPGNPSAHRQQLEHLLKMSHTSKTTIRMLPFTFGSHGAIGGGFVVLELEQEGGQVLFRESARPALTIDDPTRIGPYRNLFDELLEGSDEIDEIVESMIQGLDRR